HYVHARVGIFHPFEGYGATDRPNSVAMPLVESEPANLNQSTFFTPWGFDQAGLEVGYAYRGLSMTATMWSGLFAYEEGGVLKVAPSQGGALSKSTDSPLRNAKDVQIFLNQMLGDDVALSIYYYHGSLELPKDPLAPFVPENAWRNSFHRV